MDHRRPAKNIDPDENLNWADYVDALLHQDPRRNVLVTRPIKGRRVRDDFRNRVEVTKYMHPLLKNE